MTITSATARAALAAAVCAAVWGAPSEKVTCGKCHRAEAESLPKTEMGIGIELPAAQTLLAAHPKLATQANGYAYEVERKGGLSYYTVRGDGGAVTLPIRYAFGVNNETFVLEYEGRFYESLVSYYQNLGGLAVTIGDERLRPRSLVEAMGRPVSNEEITACFNCHGSGGVRGEKLALETLEPGLTCGHCHAGADAHRAAMSGGKPVPAPPKLAAMGAEQASEFCGQCHRTWESVIAQRLFSPINVRFQPYRLANSKCFLGSDRRIACTACHDPHRELERDIASYDHACLACHRPRNGVATTRATEKACPVADGSCASCHMPKVDLPGGVSTFTDHYIRVVRPGEAYPE
jgi:hypothetical protein